MDARAARAAGACRHSDETAADEIRQRVLAIDCAQPRNRPAATGHRDVGAGLDALEVLAESIVEITDTDFVAAFTM